MLKNGQFMKTKKRKYVKNHTLKGGWPTDIIKLVNPIHIDKKHINFICIYNRQNRYMASERFVLTEELKGRELVYKELLKTSGIFGKNSMLIKLFISYILIIVISIMPISIFAIRYSSAKMEKQAEELSANILQCASRILDEKMCIVYNESYSVLKNQAIKKLMAEEDIYSVDNAVPVMNVADYLNNIPATNELIEEAYIWFADRQAVVSNAGRAKDEEFFRERYTVDTKLYRTASDMILKNEGDLISVETPDNRKEILLIYSLDRNTAYKSSFLVLELSTAQFDSILKDVTYASEGYLIVAGRNGILFEKGNLGEEFDYKELEEESEIIAGPSGSVISKVKAGNNFIMKTTLSYNDLTIISVVESKIVTKMIRNMVLVIVLVCIILAFIGIFMASYMSMNIYGPVTDVLALIKTDSDGFKKTNEEKNELDFLKKTVRSLINKSSDTKENYDIFMGYVREKFFYWFAKEYISDEVEMQSYLKELELENISKYFTVSAVRIDDTLKVMENNSDMQLNQINMYIKNLISVAFSKLGTKVYGFFDERIVGIIILHDYDKLRIEETFLQVQKEITESFGFTISVCYSEKEEKWQKLAEIYGDVIKKLSFYSFNAENKLIYAKEYEDYSNIHPLFYNEEKIENVLSGGDCEDVDELIDEIFSVKREVSFNDVYHVFNVVINVIMKKIYEADFSQSVFFDGGDPYEQIRKFNSVYEISEYLKKYGRKTVMLLKNTSDTGSYEFNRFMSYIEENYMKDIDLLEASKHFGYSPSYFSRYFKRIVGSKFNETLNQYRITEAKKILDEDKVIMLSVVSEKVGFVNYKTFNQVFKNIVGVTPSVYQKNTKKGKK